MTFAESHLILIIIRCDFIYLIRISASLCKTHFPKKMGCHQFELSPKVTSSIFINNLKTVTSRLIRKEFPEQLQKFYWKDPVL